MQTSSAHQVLHRTFSYCTALLRASVRKFCCKECTWSLLRNFFATRLSAFGQKLLWYLPGYGTFVTLLQHKLLLYRACSKIRIQTRYSSKQNANCCSLIVYFGAFLIHIIVPILQHKLPFLIAQPGKLQGLPRSAVPGRGRLSRARAIAGAGCGVRRGRGRLSRAWAAPIAGAGCGRPSRARVAAVHRGRGLLHCGRGLRMLAQHQATWPVRLSALAFAWWTLCNGCNYLGRSGFGSVFRAVARTKKTRCKARDASIAGAHCSCHEQCCARARQSITSPGCAHRGRGSQPSIAGAGCSIASAVYSCPEQC